MHGLANKIQAEVSLDQARLKVADNDVLQNFEKEASSQPRPQACLDRRNMSMSSSFCANLVF